MYYYENPVLEHSLHLSLSLPLSPPPSHTPLCNHQRTEQLCMSDSYLSVNQSVCQQPSLCAPTLHIFVKNHTFRGSQGPHPESWSCLRRAADRFILHTAYVWVRKHVVRLMEDPRQLQGSKSECTSQWRDYKGHVCFFMHALVCSCSRLWCSAYDVQSLSHKCIHACTPIFYNSFHRHLPCKSWPLPLFLKLWYPWQLEWRPQAGTPKDVKEQVHMHTNIHI